VCPKLEFASTVWNPHHQKDIHTIEMVQRRAALLLPIHVTATLVSQHITSQLQWETLQDRRPKACIILVYKIINGLVCIQPEPYFLFHQGILTFDLYTTSQLALPEQTS